MEPIIIYTDQNGVDVGAVRSFTLDLAFGADEQSFECTFAGVDLIGGEYLYIDGTEYGGIVDQYTQSTESEATKYIGRTWHGMLAGKVLKPPSGADYYALSGDANACIRSVLAKVDLDGVLTGRATAAGFTVNYRFDRFCNAYEGLLKMLQSVGAVLMIERHDGITEVWAEKVATITDEADSDLMDFEVTRAHRVVNHLVCAGEGELQDRVTVDLYADENGNVSQTQTLFGVDEVTLYYNYSGADRDELIANGTKKLQEYQTNGGADIGAIGTGSWHVGNQLQVRDNRTGVVVTALIAKKIVKVERGVLSVDYEIGDQIAAQAAQFSADLEGIAEQPVYVPASELSYPIAINKGGTGKTTALAGYQALGYLGTIADLDNCTDGWGIANSSTQHPPTELVSSYVVHTLSNGASLRSQWLYADIGQYVRRRTTSGWGPWRYVRAAASDTAAGTFYAAPSGAAGFPTFRAIALKDMPLEPQRYNVLSLVTQTATPAANFTITAAALVVSGYTAQLVVTFQVKAALTANTEYVLGTLDAAIVPAARSAANVTDFVWGATVNASGGMYVRPSMAVGASTTNRFLQSTYILASAYSG